jgi:RNA-directed DNA polymerase
VPTVVDRIAQTVACLYLEPQVEPLFHPDSYGYRPRRSALQAVGVCRERCWRTNWVIDLDIKAFFDSVPHEFVLRAVRRHTDEQWILLYVERWLKAPLQQQDGTLVQRDRGTPQGSSSSPLLANLFLHYAFDEWMEKQFPQLRFERYCDDGVPRRLKEGSISPLLANLFLHYAFDVWMARCFPEVRFERYCDDAVVHCASERQAQRVRDAIAQRLAQCGLELHPAKTRIVYCKDANRRGTYTDERFDFLGYTFRARRSKSKTGKQFVSFSPAASDDAIKARGQ